MNKLKIFKSRKLKNKKGFTLIELIIVIVIIAILAAIAIPAMSGFKNDAERAAAEANAKTAYSALVAATVRFTPEDITFLMDGLDAGENTFQNKARSLLGNSFPGYIMSTSDGISITSITWYKTNVSGTRSCKYTPSANPPFEHTESTTL